MAMKHITTERLSSFSQAPPPSPIPTAQGSRSAVDPTTSELIEKLQRVPELILPRNSSHRLVSSSSSSFSSQPECDIIDYQGLLRNEKDVNRVVRLAKERGRFRIYGHGIPTLDLQTISQFLAETNISIFGELSSNQCFWSFDYSHHRAIVRNVIGFQNFQIFSQKIENAVRKLELIAKDLAEVINIDQHFDQSITSNSIILHNHSQIFDDDDDEEEEDNNDNGQQNSSIFAFSLLLPLPLQNDQLSMSSDTIFVTLGEQLKEWRLKDYTKNRKAVSNMNQNHYSSKERNFFSIEMRWSMSDISNIKANIKLISLTHQLVVGIIMVFFFKISGFIILSS